MADEKVPVKRPRFENPLTKTEQVIIGLLVFVVGGVYFVADYGLVEMKKSLDAYKAQASGRLKADEAQKIEDEIRQAEIFRAQNTKWAALVPKLKAYFPSDPAKALTYIDLL